MKEDHIDSRIREMARDYQSRLAAARSAFPNDAMTAGNKAQTDWIADVRLRGATQIKAEPRTGVDSAGGGQSRYDVVFNLMGTDIYLEVQATGYASGHKPVQEQGQLIGFAHVSTGVGVIARYYKIFGNPRQIYRWSRRAAQGALSKADYAPKHIMFY